MLVQIEAVRGARSGLWETARVLDDDALLASVHSYGSSFVVRFPASRRIVLTFHDQRRLQRTLTVDAELRAYSLDSSPPSRPLAGLARALASELAPRGASTNAAAPVDAKRGRSWLLVISGAVLTCTGIWQLSCADSLEERALGALCATFFATTTWLSWQDRGRR